MYTNYVETYELGRLCLYCGLPIADQVHKGRLYHESLELPNGSVQDCKEAAYAPIRKANLDLIKTIGLYYKEVSDAIKELITGKGETVNLEDINRKGIQLHRRMLQEEHTPGLFTFYFHPYAIKQISFDQFIIIAHDLF
jgi:hypothetical protein